MDSVFFTTVVMPLIISVASAITNAIKAFNIFLQIVELYMKRKLARESPTCQHKHCCPQAKRKKLKRE